MAISRSRIRAAIKKYGRARVNAAIRRARARKKSSSSSSNRRRPTAQQVSAARKSIARNKASSSSSNRNNNVSRSSSSSNRNRSSAPVKTYSKKTIDAVTKRLGSKEKVLNAIKKKFWANSNQYKSVANSYKSIETPTKTTTNIKSKKIIPLKKTNPWTFLPKSVTWNIKPKFTPKKQWLGKQKSNNIPKTSFLSESVTWIKSVPKNKWLGKQKTEKTFLSNSVTGKNNWLNNKTSKREADLVNQARLKYGSDENILANAEKTFGKDSDKYKATKKLLTRNVQKDWTENLDKLTNLNEKELKDKKIETVKTVTDKKISETVNNYVNAAKVENSSNENLQNFYTNLQSELNDFLKETKKTKKEALDRTKTTELNRVAGQVRAMLASRWTNVSDLSPEQLISMSWELWVKALEEINNATTKMEDEINTLTEKNMEKINKYKEQWLIKQSEHDREIERLREMKVKLISDLKDNYITSAFKMAFDDKKENTIDKWAVINAVNSLAVQLWLQPTQMWVINQYTNYADATKATKAMLEDLDDTNSALYKAVKENKDYNEKIARVKSTSKSTTKKVPAMSSATRTKIAAYLDSIWLSNIVDIDTMWNKDIGAVANAIEWAKWESEKNRFYQIINSNNPIN